MEGERFDAVVRALSAGASRRGVLGLLAGVAAGAFARGEQEVRAQDCKRNGKACKKNSQCCSNNCVGGDGGPTSKSGGTCQPAIFQGTCAAGESQCGGDPFRNCNPDPTGPVCTCIRTAADGTTVCHDQSSGRCTVLDCDEDTDCASLGEGYVCVDTRPLCLGCGGTTNRNVCVRQCNV